jgi:hypothetical protein
MAIDVKSEQAIMHDIWRAAYTNPDGITIPCESEASAKRLRFALYNAVKPIKSGAKVADEGLKAAIANCSIGFTDDKKGLCVQQKVATQLNKILLGVLAEQGVTVRSTEDYLLDESFKRLSELTIEAPKEDKLVNHLAMSYGARG